MSPTHANGAVTRQARVNATRVAHAIRKLLSCPWLQLSHALDPADPREDYLTKSPAAATRWSGCNRKIAKAKKQALDMARREKAALRMVFELATFQEVAMDDIQGEFADDEDSEYFC